MDHRGGNARTITAIALIDVLDDLLAPLVLEIHVDIGRLAAFRGNEPLEQQIDLRRIDGRDVQAVAHGGIGRRTTPLAEDVVADGIAHDVMHRQEIPRVVELRDDAQLLLDGFADMRRNAIGIAHRSALPGQVGQMFVRRQARRDRFVRIFIGQFLQRKAAAPDDLLRAQHSVGMVAEQPRHLLRGFQVTLGIGLQGKARLVDAAAETNAGHHVLQRTPIGQVVEHVVGGHHRQRQLGHRAQTARIIATIAAVGGEICPAAKISPQALDICAEAGIQPVRRDDKQDLSLAVFQQIGVVQEAAVGGLRRIAAVAMRHASLADGEQTRQPSPGRAILRVAEQIRRVVAE